MDPNWNNDPNSAEFLPNPAVFGAAYGADQKAKILLFGDAVIDQMEAMDERHTLRENFIWDYLKLVRQDLDQLDLLSPENADKVRDLLGDLQAVIASGDFESLVNDLRAARQSNSDAIAANQQLLTTINQWKTEVSQTLSDLEDRVAELEANSLTKDEGDDLFRTAMIAVRAGELAGHNAKMAAWDDMIAKTFDPAGFDGQAELDAWVAAQAA